MGPCYILCQYMKMKFREENSFTLQNTLQDICANSFTYKGLIICSCFLLELQETVKQTTDRPVNLTHWGRVTHICISKLTIIGWDNGLLPGRHQAIIWTNAEILLIGPLGTKFSEILIEIHTFSFKKMHLKMSSGKWWPFCHNLNVLNGLAPIKLLPTIS